MPEQWTLRAVAGRTPATVGFAEIPAFVPGCAHTDLLAAGLIADPYLHDQENRLRWIGHVDWQYSTTFDADPVQPGEQVELVFEGLDTVASVELNGRQIARTRNMHRSYRIDVGEYLRPEANALTVLFASPIEAAERFSSELGPRPHVNRHPFNAIRKMAAGYGWDWGPELVTSGIWRPVYLERWRGVRIAAVRPLSDSSADVAVHVDLDWADRTRKTAKVTATMDGFSVSTVVAPGDRHTVLQLQIAQPRWWWPRGYGNPELYDLDVILEVDDERQQWHGEIGLRTVELHGTPDADGTPFTILVNGRDIFVLGANWIPDDCFPHRVDADRYTRRVEQAVAAGINLLRVWGGGIYESEHFYRACDRAGVLVWQDFLFACAAYGEEEPMRSEVIAEAREAVTRLCPHPSLVLWNGGNENLWGYRDWGWQEPLAGRSWGHGYYHDVLPAILAELDPSRPYTPGSPYSPDDDQHPNDDNHGTTHIWDVWNQLDYRAYLEHVPRFVSEFGFQGPPTWATLTRAIDADQLAPDSVQMLAHQKAEDGVGKLHRGLAGHLPLPQDIDDWHWATSLNQARAVQFGIEHFRSHRPRCAGMVVWQLNDCWPVISWAAIDGDGRTKPLWYALRHAYADRLLTVQPRPGGLAVVAVNDTDLEWNAPLVAERLDFSGSTKAAQRADLAVPPRAAVTVPLDIAVALADHPGRELIRVQGGAVRGLRFFAEDIRSELPEFTADTTVTVTGSGYQVRVRAVRLIKDLALLADRIDPGARVDEQLVTLLPGETITFTVAGPAGLDRAAFTDPRVLRSANQLKGFRRCPQLCCPTGLMNSRPRPTGGSCDPDRRHRWQRQVGSRGGHRAAGPPV